MSILGQHGVPICLTELALKSFENKNFFQVIDSGNLEWGIIQH